MHGGGAERVASLLCNYWASQGHNVVLMPTYSARGRCDYPLDEWVKLDFLADHVHTSQRSHWSRIQRLLAVRRVVRSYAPHVVVSFLTDVNIAAIVSTRGLNVPVVVSERSYPPANRLPGFLRLLRRLSYSAANAVVMQTEDAGRWLVSACPGAKGHVIANPVVFPLPVIEPRLKPSEIVKDGQRLLLAVGRLGAEKRFGQLIDSFAGLARRFTDWNLVILGEGEERERLEIIRDALDMKAKIHLPGYVGNLGEWYERADLFVLNSQFEGFPNVLLEVMSYGVPAVSVDCLTGPGEIIQHGENGWLVPPGEGSGGLTTGLKALMADSGLRVRMGKMAANVRSRYSMQRIGAQWDTVLRSVTN